MAGTNQTFNISLETTAETPVVVEIVQRSPKGAGKEPLLSVGIFHGPTLWDTHVVLGTPPSGRLFGF